MRPLQGHEGFEKKLGSHSAVSLEPVEIVLANSMIIPNY